MKDRAKSKGRKSLKGKLVILTACSILVSVMPLLLLFLVNLPRYVRSVEDAIKLSVGAIVVIVILVVKAIGKLKIPRRVVTSTIFLMLCWLLSTMLSDLLIIAAVWWGSEILDFVVFAPWIKRTRQALLVEKTAAASAEATVEAVKAYLGRS
jgi:hypothetical protein